MYCVCVCSGSCSALIRADASAACEHSMFALLMDPAVFGVSIRLTTPRRLQLCVIRGPPACLGWTNTLTMRSHKHEQERKQRAHALEFCTSHLHTEMEAR